MKKSEGQKERERKSLIDSRWAYKGRIVDLKIETYQFDDKPMIAEIVHHRGAVVIVPIDEKGRILLIQQWRRGASEVLLELPAGTLEEKEGAEACARRELQEETGFSAKQWKSLGGFYSAPGFCTEYLHLFVAEALDPSPLPPDEDEAIDLAPTPLLEAIQMIEKNQIRDAKTVAGLFKYYLWRQACAKS
jgi:ADP-ribose pyrophosphatase